jgi:diadenosine tetraphosphate (Ap4A) HIT family hydrolase
MSLTRSYLQGNNMANLTPSGCRFCQIALGLGHSGVDDVLEESDNYVAVASIGSLAPGWILIVPKSHRLSLAETFASDELQRFQVEVAVKIARVFGGAPVRMFEHGANSEGSMVGCGVNHAHLHLVPATLSLVPHFPEANERLCWSATNRSSIARQVVGREYLFYSDDALDLDASGRIALVNTPVSQYFRRAFASSVGRDHEFDYRLFSNRANSDITIEHFRRDRALSPNRIESSSRRVAA